MHTTNFVCLACILLGHTTTHSFLGNFCGNGRLSNFYFLLSSQLRTCELIHEDNLSGLKTGTLSIPKFNFVCFLLHYLSRCILQGSLCQTFRLVDFEFYKFSSVFAIEGCSLSSILFLFSQTDSCFSLSPPSFPVTVDSRRVQLSVPSVAPRRHGASLTLPAGRRHPSVFP